jgi:hypothetical protein
MPSIVDEHDRTPVDTGHGSSFPKFAFPPVLVLERGESLAEFAARVDHEPITVIQALVVVVKRVQVCLLKSAVVLVVC